MPGDEDALDEEDEEDDEEEEEEEEEDGDMEEDEEDDDDEEDDEDYDDDDDDRYSAETCAVPSEPGASLLWKAEALMMRRSGSTMPDAKSTRASARSTMSLRTRSASRLMPS